MAWPINLPYTLFLTSDIVIQRNLNLNNVKLVMYSTEPTLMLSLFRLSYIELEYQYIHNKSCWHHLCILKDLFLKL